MRKKENEKALALQSLLMKSCANVSDFAHFLLHFRNSTPDKSLPLFI